MPFRPRCVCFRWSLSEVLFAVGAANVSDDYAAVAKMLGEFVEVAVSDVTPIFTSLSSSLSAHTKPKVFGSASSCCVLNGETMIPVCTRVYAQSVCPRAVHGKGCRRRFVLVLQAVAATCLRCRGEETVALSTSALVACHPENEVIDSLQVEYVIQVIVGEDDPVDVVDEVTEPVEVGNKADAGVYCQALVLPAEEKPAALESVLISCALTRIGSDELHPLRKTSALSGSSLSTPARLW